MVNKRFEYKKICHNYPITGVIMDNESPKYRASEVMYLSWSPTNNCQTFSIGCIQEIFHREYTKTHIIEIFKIIYDTIRKAQMIIDVEDDYLENVIKILRPVIAKKYSKKYISTNGSKMNLLIIQLDVDKLK